MLENQCVRSLPFSSALQLYDALSHLFAAPIRDCFELLSPTGWPTISLGSSTRLCETSLSP